MSEQGFFLTIEGIDGTGKTTQLNLLKDYFECSGVQVVTAKEPGDIIGADGHTSYVGSNIGHQVRHMLFKDPTTHKLAPGVADLLFMADHVQLQEQVIAPALRQGKVVLCDRYSDSELAYSVGRNIPEWVFTAFHAATTLIPDVTVLLIGDAEVMQQRSKRPGGNEAGKQEGKTWASVSAQMNIQNAYLRLLQGQPRTVIVDVTEETPASGDGLLKPRLLSVEEVHAVIRSKIVDRYLRHVNVPTLSPQMELFPLGSAVSSQG